MRVGEEYGDEVDWVNYNVYTVPVYGRGGVASLDRNWDDLDLRRPSTIYLKSGNSYQDPFVGRWRFAVDRCSTVTLDERQTRTDTMGGCQLIELRIWVKVLTIYPIRMPRLSLERSSYPL